MTNDETKSKIEVVDAGVMEYRAAWDLQLALHERVLSGELAAGALMLVEHPPVITLGRRANAAKNLLASLEMLALRKVEVVETDRGGDITFHGPGQLVVYPIINLNTYKMNLHAYMRFLEEVVIELLRRYGIEGTRSAGATGVWVAEGGGAELAKICAMGVRLKRWVTLHGLALNVTTDLTFFDLINPCGLGRPVTSMAKLMAEQTPTMHEIKRRMIEKIALRGNARLNASCASHLYIP
ncbi:MAG: lipoyl(octanoyl) transferase LipB [Phycisphaerales bacterium]|nr:lipoyl(octanoyl) transferase LipB [Phycisphaerales bacterium]